MLVPDVGKPEYGGSDPDLYDGLTWQVCERTITTGLDDFVDEKEDGDVGKSEWMSISNNVRDISCLDDAIDGRKSRLAIRPDPKPVTVSILESSDESSSIRSAEQEEAANSTCSSLSNGSKEGKEEDEAAKGEKKDNEGAKESDFERQSQAGSVDEMVCVQGELIRGLLFESFEVLMQGSGSSLHDAHSAKVSHFSRNAAIVSSKYKGFARKIGQHRRNLGKGVRFSMPGAREKGRDGAQVQPDDGRYLDADPGSQSRSTLGKHEDDALAMAADH